MIGSSLRVGEVGSTLNLRHFHPIPDPLGTAEATLMWPSRVRQLVEASKGVWVGVFLVLAHISEGVPGFRSAKKEVQFFHFTTHLVHVGDDALQFAQPVSNAVVVKVPFPIHRQSRSVFIYK